MSPWGRFALVPYRAMIAGARVARQAWPVLPWLWRSKELGNYTYDYADLDTQAAVELAALVSGAPRAEVQVYLEELANDKALRQHLRQRTRGSAQRHIADAEPRFGRRLLIYLLVRAVKPRVVVEAGVDKGLGACVVAAALGRNQGEGRTGRYWGVDVNAGKSFLFGPPYAAHGEVVRADSVSFLRAFGQPIELFVHDTLSAPAHEEQQFAELERRLADGAVVVSTWYTECFLDFARRSGRQCLVFAERPVAHWHPGEHLPVAFRLPARAGAEPKGGAGA